MDTTTGIRLEVPQSLYERLQDEQEKRRIKTGKKPALASIIQEFCSEKLEEIENVHSDVHRLLESEHNSEKTDSGNNKPDSDTEKRLRLWDEQLSLKNKSLLEQERKLKEQEKELFKEKMEVLDLRNKVLDEREKLQQKSLEGTESMIEHKLLQNELKHKDEKIQQLEGELNKTKSKLQRTHEDRKEIKTKTLWEQVMGFLPIIATVLSLIAVYLSAQKNKKPALPSGLKELAGLFDHLSEDEQKKLGEKFKTFADTHTAPVEENKILQLNISK